MADRVDTLKRLRQKIDSPFMPIKPLITFVGPKTAFILPMLTSISMPACLQAMQTKHWHH
ncbi:MAG: hypothetical protein B7X44_10605 [Halothiobacillus sp. 15-55-196]|nr:MAG: hypothetical protein B7X44_10605 [Halothiobacillus sp. 15-55-196]